MPIHRHKGPSETCSCIRGHFETYFCDSEGQLTGTIISREARSHSQKGLAMQAHACGGPEAVFAGGGRSMP